MTQPAKPAKTAWRSLDDLADTPEFRAQAAEEFPGFSNIYESLGEAELRGGTTLDRRKFVALSAAGLGLAGLAGTGCRRPDFEILPYVKTPDDVKYNLPTYYATSIPRAGGSLPVLVESHQGRPTKVEGNPGHPASFGATDVHAQASVLDLYSPDRSVDVLKLVGKSWSATTWSDFDSTAAVLAQSLKAAKGARLALLTDGVVSPAVDLVRAEMAKTLPEAKWFAYEAVGDAARLEGTRLAFGEALTVHPKFENADRILSLDCDFLGLEPDGVALTRGFQARRKPEKIEGRKLVKPVADGFEMNRLYVVEPTFTVTGTMADHRLRLPSSHVGDYLIALAAKLGVAVDAAKAGKLDIDAKWLDEVAKDLQSKGKRSVVVVGQRQPAWVHALAAAVNDKLGAAGTTVEYRPLPASAAANGTLAQLADAVKAGAVETLVILAGNPVFTAPADVGLGDLLAKVKTVIRLGAVVDETSDALAEKAAPDAARWHLPVAHFLESWGDGETADGTYVAVQPLIAPLYGSSAQLTSYTSPLATATPARGGRSVLEVLSLLSEYKGASNYATAAKAAYDAVSESFLAKWRPGAGAKADNANERGIAWRTLLHTGFLPNTARAAVAKPLNAAAVTQAVGGYAAGPRVSPENLELSLHADYKMIDGRNLTNTWLLELPDPVTKLSWDNAAIVSPATAARLGVRHGSNEHVRVSGVADEVEIRLGDGDGAYRLKLPVFVLPGQADNVVSVHLGWGKLRVAHIAEGGGYNAFPFRTSAAPFFATGLKVEKTGGSASVACTQEHGVIPTERAIFEQFNASDYARQLKVHERHANQTLGVHPRPKGSEKQQGGGKDEHDHSHDSHAHDHGDEHHFDPRKTLQAGAADSLHSSVGNDSREYRKISLDLAYPESLDSHHQWGMVIDLNACTGCSACMVACQSENNVPIVGKPEIIRNREMHWIRLDRYFTTDESIHGEGTDDPAVVHQPMACVQCEAAPCEAVCPVNAAVHSPEGLNLQVYNRCIGTRYCANNCPYKVRRFNWFNFNLRPIDELRLGVLASKKDMADTLQMQKNPDVTVRGRGVMEKCNYCVQRLERGKIGAKLKATAATGPDGRYSKPADPRKAGYDIVEVVDRQGETVGTKENRPDGAKPVRRVRQGVIVPDGTITPACAQACPSQAIVFGNLKDESSLVYQLKQLNTDYLTLGELNVKPRTSYRPRLRNPNPAMAKTPAKKEAHA